MKRKVSKVGKFRLSPNEEALLLKEEYERRRKLRLQQVREQERNIASQIRQNVKQRRNELLHQLAEELRKEWQRAHEKKVKALEELYLASLRTIGEGHRQAKEHKPDPEALAKQRERTERAERRHKEALKKQKNQKQQLKKEQTWRENARKQALKVEKERAAKIASLPPPPPHPFDNIELNVPTVKVYDRNSFAVSHRHLLDPYVDRELDIDQPDARLLAEEESTRQEGLQNEEEREKREQLEKAHLRGKQAMKMVRLARDREKFMKELEQMQNMDLARRRQIVAQMPPQLFEPGYRRAEIREEWQRELECAFEDMYTGEQKMKGDLIVHLDPQPLPTFSDHSQDDELDLSQEPGDLPSKLEDVQEAEPGVEVKKSPETHSKLALTKLLSKIRNQKDQWTSRCDPVVPSETGTIESGTISSRERRLCESETEGEPNHDAVSEAEEVPDILDQTVVAGNAVVSHSQEQSTKTEKEADMQNQLEWLEHQKQQQLAMLQEIEKQRIQLEVELLKACIKDQEEEIKRKEKERAQQSEIIQRNDRDPPSIQQQETEQKFETATGLQIASSSTEDDHIQMIRNYQQHLLMQNRMHKQSVDEARKHLQEYQNKLKQRYPSVSTALFGPTAAGFAHLNALPEQSLLLQGFDACSKTAHLLPNNTPVQDFVQPVGYSEFPGSLEEPSEQKNLQKTLDMDRRGHMQTIAAQVDQRLLQSSHAPGSCQETRKVSLVGTSATQPLEFHGNPRLFQDYALKTQDTSAKMQPVPPVRQVQFTLPTDMCSDSSVTFHPYKSEACAALAEDIQLPASLKHRPIEKRVESEQTCHPPVVQPLPSLAAGEPGRLQELKNESGSLSSYSEIVELRDRMLASSRSIQVQQEHLRELQEQLNKQREALLSRQKVQEDLLMHKHAQLKKEMEQQQEALKVFLQQAGRSDTYGEMASQARETDKMGQLATLTNEGKYGNPEEAKLDPLSPCTENKFLFPSNGSSEQIEPFQSTWGREPKWRPSKPPLAKVKLGLELQQHELSVIPELDTPRSSRLSATGRRESLNGDTFFMSNAGELQSSRHPDESFHEEMDMLRITATDKDAKEQSCSESLRFHLSPSWHEKRVTGASNLHSPVQSRESSRTDQDLLSHAADIGRQLALYPGSSLRQNNTVALKSGRSPGLLSSQTDTAYSHLSSSSISPGSFTANERPDSSFASSEWSSPKEQPGHFNSSTKEKENITWDPSVSSLYEKDGASGVPDSCFSYGQRLHSESRIQQIIEKYTKYSSWSLSKKSSPDLTVGAEVTNTVRNSPQEPFQPLEPSPDFDNFSSLSEYTFSHESKNFSKSSDLCRSHELPISNSEDRSTSFSFLAIGKQDNTLQTKEGDEKRKEHIEGAEDVFQPLLAETTSGELSQCADKPVDFTALSEQATSEQIRKSIENMHLSSGHVYSEALERDEEVNLPSPIKKFRGLSLTPVEDCGLFYQHISSNGLQKNSLGTMSPVRKNVSREEDLCFIELPGTSTDPKLKAVPETVIMNEDKGLDHFLCTSYAVEELSSLSTKTLLNPSHKAGSEISVSPVPDVLQSSPSKATPVKSSDSLLAQSSIPVWEWQMGRGIMEEPELTLISSNDISIAGSEWEPLSQADTRTEAARCLSRSNRSEAKSSPERRGFLPLNADVNGAISAQPSNCPSAQSPKEDLCQNENPKIMLLEFPSAPGSLQESFLKQKKKFIEGSCKRLEKLKSRQNPSRKPQVKALPQKTVRLHKPKENSPLSEGAVSHLKQVEEVRVCSAEDRRTAEIGMHQRTSRLYNNLAEVKTRKEERERREIYAQNRAKAKEFQKKTLEMLRAKKPR